jgi:hypothetical protein
LSIRVPPPPDSRSVDPLLLKWEAGRPLVRCHSVRFGATEFNPGIGKGRFHPFEDLSGKGIVPILYAADDLDGSLSESIFHNVPVTGPGKRVGRFALEEMVVSTLVCERDLSLVQLFGFGLRRLGVTRLELIETGAEDYGETAAWARSLHASSEAVDGLVWVSRQNDASRALVLFGDRVARSSLEIFRHPLALFVSPGFDEVQLAAEQAGILILD